MRRGRAVRRGGGKEGEEVGGRREGEEGEVGREEGKREK